MKSGHGYYARRLAGNRLERCYRIAPPRVQQYLRSEIEFVLERIEARTVVLELGCGYGRVLAPLSQKAGLTIGADTSEESLDFARSFLADHPTCRLVMADAGGLSFLAGSFDLTVCIQNGLSAFKLDPATVLAEALRVTRRGGRLLFSSYAPAFWEERLAWFELQAAEGLIGPIDRRASGNGVIVCEDGFRARTIDRSEWEDLARRLSVACRIEEVDASSVFCELLAE